MKPEKQSTSDLRSEIIQSLIEEFQDDPEYREGYTEEFFNAKIATQIKVLREQREWSQSKLAELSEMAQARVSVLEDVNYDAWTLNVLRRFGKAFGLVVDVEFKEYGEFIKEFEMFGQERLQKRSFNDDPVFTKLSSIRRFPTKLNEPVKNPSKGTLTLRMLAEVRSDPKKKLIVQDETNARAPIQAENTVVKLFPAQTIRRTG